MKKINLEEILRNQIGYMGNEPNLTRLIEERATEHDILEAMREACKQVLILAADNATCTINKYSISINRKSITDTINQVE